MGPRSEINLKIDSNEIHVFIHCSMGGGELDAHTTIATTISDHFTDGSRRYLCCPGRHSWQSRGQYHPSSHYPLFTLCLARSWSSGGAWYWRLSLASASRSTGILAITSCSAEGC